MAKRICRNIVRRYDMDQISTLPDDVLVRILSLIPTEQAVYTSFLSKRWKSLWTLLPVLDFDYVRFSEKHNALSPDERKRRFLDFVEHVFFLHKPEPLQNLRLAFDIAEFEDYISKASLLVKSAMRSNCLTIDLDFTSQTEREFILQLLDYDAWYTLPRCFFPDQSVSQLNLTSCKFTSSFYESFTSVKTVKFSRVQLQRDSVYHLVSKCPCLEDLHLIYCKFPSSFFELISPESNLKCLVLQDCSGNEGLFFEHAYIHIPTLLQLKFVGYFTTGYLSIYNSENLMEAEIDILYCPPNKHKLLCKLLKDLQNVKSLTLSSNTLEALNTNGGINLPTPFNNLKHLIVLGQADREKLGLMCLLRNSPYLETLSIDFHRIFETEDKILSALYNLDEETVLQPHLLPSECIAHLIKIRIENFLGVKAEMEFVKLILLSSLCLKEMVICIHSTYNYLKFDIRKEHHKILKKKKAETIDSLLAFTRASPSAKILLK
ncbi:hypothetical protein MKW94_007901 [Papaver nudicaule]|uniref:F-box domain-containing protein n=1 Tax=Papaver nudicaule TaxID=74823 RepID=A0AA41RNX7_PAPNU|nr:hypothetical protein [Papaver nudicaule]